jgi:hypothetical protein
VGAGGRFATGAESFKTEARENWSRRGRRREFSKPKPAKIGRVATGSESLKPKLAKLGRVSSGELRGLGSHGPTG